VNDELGRMCKEAAVAKVEALFQLFPGGTKKKSQKSLIRYPVSRLRSKPGFAPPEYDGTILTASPLLSFTLHGTRIEFRQSSKTVIFNN
jgi:hypothetical protein